MFPPTFSSSPFAPQFGNALGKPHGRTQTLKYVNGYAIADLPKSAALEAMVPPEMPEGMEPVAEEEAKETEGGIPMSKLPAWVAFDRKVCRFYAYFKEGVDESYQENYRIRKCIIYYYLEDDSIHVAEPKQENSGIPQGVFIKRHIIPKDGSPKEVFNIMDLEIGGNVSFYGRMFHIVDCDPFTKSFLAAKGVEVPSAIPYPEEPIEKYRDSLRKVKSGGPPKPRDDDLTRYVEAKLGRASNILLQDKLKQFIENGGKVLRFFCVWDDRNKLYGDRRPYVLHYFLSDDTVEILEVNEPNSGCDPFPLMLKRSKLPKGELHFDMSLGKRSDDYYNIEDLGIGKVINVYGRPFLLHDCDEFTKKWYTNKGGKEEAAFAPLDISEEPENVPETNLPEYNGFGSLEDTQQNCISLIPKPPKKDFHKLMYNEKKVLRFVAKFYEGEGQHLSYSDIDRIFILSYFLSDDTIAIFEPPARNSGIIGGKFLERNSGLKKPGTVEPYMENDVYVGALLNVHNRIFELVEADEYTLQYMEENKHIFLFSDITKILEALTDSIRGKDKDIRSAFIDIDKNGTGFISLEELELALKASGISHNKQELVTLMRKFDIDRTQKISVQEFFETIGLDFSQQ